MSRYISAKHRKYVQERANNTCEYCKVPDMFSFIGYEIDHIISIKHGGVNEVENLAWACALRNMFKGTDVGTLLPPANEFVRLFNPRIDDWNMHFKVDASLILPNTSIGKATVKILQLNHIDRLLERQMLADADLFPINKL